MTERKQPQTAAILDPAMLQYFDERASEWLAKPDDLHSWMERKALVMLQVLEHIVNNPPAGRSGNIVQAGAVKEFFAQAEKVLGLLKEGRKKDVPTVPPVP